MRRFARSGLGSALLGVATLVGASPAGADIIGVTFVAPTVAAFTPVVLNNQAQITTAAVGTFTVTDSRAVAAGWHVIVGATAFCEQASGGGCVSGGKSLPAGSLDQSLPTVTGVAPLPSTSAAIGIDGSSGSIASAASGTGLGTYTFSTSTLTLHIPAVVYARTYVSTVTYSIATGP